MEKVRGFKYTVEGFHDVERFAKGILVLTNIKSSRQGLISDVTTIEGMWVVHVVAFQEIGELLEMHIGKVTDKEEITIVKLGLENLQTEERAVIGELEDKYLTEGGKGYFIDIKFEY